MKATALLFVLALGCLVALAASDPIYYYGASTYLGNGAFRAYFAQESEVPVAIGLEFSTAFFHDPPQFEEHMAADGDMEMHEQTLNIPFPDEVPVYTPFQSLELDYSAGHTPPYDKVHFDFHFYFQNLAIRTENITAGTGKKICGDGGASPDTWCRGIAAFPAACCPPVYGNIGVVVPAMGAHLVDLLGTELLPPTDPNYAPFTSQMTFGAFNGRITFYEVMITLDRWKEIMNGAPTSCHVIRLPQEFADPGYYPSMYCMSLTAAGNLRMELNTFAHYATPGCKGPVDPTTTCSLLPSDAKPSADFLKYCQCS